MKLSIPNRSPPTKIFIPYFSAKNPTIHPTGNAISPILIPSLKIILLICEGVAPIALSIPKYLILSITDMLNELYITIIVHTTIIAITNIVIYSKAIFLSLLLPLPVK